MKKVFIGIIIMIILFSLSTVRAENVLITSEKEESIVRVKQDTQEKIEKYKEKYGSESYATTAFILDKVRLYSIPLCFMGIVVGLLYQYVLGTRRLDKKHKGFNLILSFVTILVICQVLPLIFAVIVTNWR